MKTAASCVSVCESQGYQIHRQVERTLRRRHSHVLPSLLHEGRISNPMHRLCHRSAAAAAGVSACLPAALRVASTALGSFAFASSGIGVPLSYAAEPASPNRDSWLWQQGPQTSPRSGAALCRPSMTVSAPYPTYSSNLSDRRLGGSTMLVAPRCCSCCCCGMEALQCHMGDRVGIDTILPRIAPLCSKGSLLHNP